MGSVGTDRLSDLPPQRAAAATSVGAGQQGGSGSGGNACDQDVTAELEDVARCSYFRTNGHVPPSGTDVEVDDTLHGSRIAVVTTSEREVVGYLPVQYSTLASCLKTWTHQGEVTHSSELPTPHCSVALTAAAR